MIGVVWRPIVSRYCPPRTHSRCGGEVGLVGVAVHADESVVSRECLVASHDATAVHPGLLEEIVEGPVVGGAAGAHAEVVLGLASDVELVSALAVGLRADPDASRAIEGGCRGSGRRHGGSSLLAGTGAGTHPKNGDLLGSKTCF